MDIRSLVSLQVFLLDNAYIALDKLATHDFIDINKKTHIIFRAVLVGNFHSFDWFIEKP